MVAIQSSTEDPTVSLSRAVDAITTPDALAETYTVTIGSDRPGLSSGRVRNVSDNEVVFVEFLHMHDTDEDGNLIEPPRKVTRDLSGFVLAIVHSWGVSGRCTSFRRWAMSVLSS